MYIRSLLYTCSKSNKCKCILIENTYSRICADYSLRSHRYFHQFIIHLQWKCDKWDISASIYRVRRQKINYLKSKKP